MPSSDFFTPSQRRAWNYVQSGYNRGLGEVQALKEYRSGGGKIRTSSWVELWNRNSESADKWTGLYMLKDSDTVPTSFYEPTGVNYRNKYALNVKLNVRQEDGSILHDIYRTLSTNSRLTLGEWKSAINEAMKEDPSSYSTEVLQITSMEFYERS